jgi:CheY-like chemotaxis protein
MDDSNDTPSRPGRRERPALDSTQHRKSMKLRRLHLAPRAATVVTRQNDDDVLSRAPAPTPLVTFRRRLFGAPDLRGIRVLTVEDDEDLRALLALRFESCGALVSTASSCAEATLTLVAGTWDILIADIGLPDGNGYALARIARALPVPPTCIALSGRGSHDDIDEARRAGFRLHVRKPCDPGVLIHIAEQLRTSRTD